MCKEGEKLYGVKLKTIRDWFDIRKRNIITYLVRIVRNYYYSQCHTDR